MKLPMVPPTNPPAYVGPLRTSSSSVKSTVETMNCTGCGQTGNGLAGPPTRAAARGRISADLSVGIDCEGVCGWRLPRPRRPVSGAVREPQATAPETADWRSARSPSPPAAPHDRFGDGAATSRRRDHCARPHSPEREPAAGRLATRSGEGGRCRSYRSHDCICVLAAADPACAWATQTQAGRAGTRTFRRHGAPATRAEQEPRSRRTADSRRLLGSPNGEV